MPHETKSFSSHSVCRILRSPEDYKGGSAAIYGMAQTIPDRGLVNHMTWIYLDALYATKRK